MTTATSKLAQVAKGRQTCTRCKRTKTLDRFARHPTAATGIYSICDACRSSAISAGRKQAVLERVQQATLDKLSAALVPPEVKIDPIPEQPLETPHTPALGRLRDAVAYARGLATLDTRLALHAAELESILTQLKEIEA